MPARPKIDINELVNLHDQGATVTQMMRKLGIARSSVIWHLRRLGYETAKPNETINQHGYAVVYMPDHPKASYNGYVKRCILMWEAYHGKPFPKGKEPHHRDLDRLNDNPKNIEPLSHSEHSRLHYRLRGRRGKFTKTEAKETTDG